METERRPDGDNVCGSCGNRWKNGEPLPVATCGFAVALTAIKDGRKVARIGWNGKGMYAFLQKGYPDGIPLNKNTSEATGIPEGTVCRFRPYLMLFTAQGDFAHWVPSGSDILADDWFIVQ
ncbi:DUF2829 domain-containing protein [Anaeroselena agilis]|uniref:DUF2829 domain-containing protein n=1 Tax=Anaeroselena agilis TaxID=3063788 RepID=A0ABU3NZF5_9FIRM|nr:DUF2829 domain-containing protein [Selenomonadales bacterium 4137-cl]